MSEARTMTVDEALKYMVRLVEGKLARGGTLGLDDLKPAYEALRAQDEAHAMKLEQLRVQLQAPPPLVPPVKVQQTINEDNTAVLYLTDRIFSLTTGSTQALKWLGEVVEVYGDGSNAERAQEVMQLAREALLRGLGDGYHDALRGR
jgi:hypothetical protein